MLITATSALDNESEKIVQEALDRATEGMVLVNTNIFCFSLVNRSNNNDNCTSFINDSSCG